MNEFSPKVNMEGYCVLQAADVDAERTGFFAGYIAFGNWTDDPNGPSVRFHGGTVFSSCFQNAPSLQYDLYGECHVVFWEWMNPGNCPHAFDNKYVRIWIKKLHWLTSVGKQHGMKCSPELTASRMIPILAYWLVRIMRSFMFFVSEK